MDREIRQALAEGNVDRIFVALLWRLYGRGSDAPPRWRPWLKGEELAPDPLQVRDPEYRELHRDYVARWRPRDGLRWLVRRGRVPVPYRRRVLRVLDQQNDRGG